jgi:hypothetical protein
MARILTAVCCDCACDGRVWCRVRRPAVPGKRVAVIACNAGIKGRAREGPQVLNAR